VAAASIPGCYWEGSCGSTAHIADPILLVGAGSIVARHAKWELTASLCIAEICKRCKVVVRLARALARLAMQQSLLASWGDCILLLDSDSLDGGHARFFSNGDALTWCEDHQESQKQGPRATAPPLPLHCPGLFPPLQHNFSQSARDVPCQKYLVTGGGTTFSSLFLISSR